MKGLWKEETGWARPPQMIGSQRFEMIGSRSSGSVFSLVGFCETIGSRSSGSVLLLVINTDIRIFCRSERSSCHSSHGQKEIYHVVDI